MVARSSGTTGNRRLFEDLAAGGTLRLRRGGLFDSAPLALTAVSFDKIEGMMLGLAIGDALGNTSESSHPAARFAARGEIRDYLPNRFAGGLPRGLPSDDTQLAFWTLDQINGDRGFIPERLATRFASERIFGMGRSVGQFVDNYRAGVRPWYRCAPPSAGNGALMRVAPTLIPHLPAPSAELWVDAALAAAITHNDSSSTSACLAFIAMLWQALAMRQPPEPLWWLETYLNVAGALELDERHQSNGPAYQGYEGTLTRFVEMTVPSAYRKRMRVVEACNLWHSGAFLLETVPSVLYLLAAYGHDPEEAIVRAVNDTWDNDTIGAIVGAAMGALYGSLALPQRWISGLLGRTSAADDGKVFAILEETRRIWGSG